MLQTSYIPYPIRYVNSKNIHSQYFRLIINMVSGLVNQSIILTICKIYLQITKVTPNFELIKCPTLRRTLRDR